MAARAQDPARGALNAARRAGRAGVLATVAAVAALACGSAAAGTLRLCAREAAFDATQQDRLLRVGAIVKAELEASGQPVALIARSGLDLARLGVRYSHAGVALRDGLDTPWAVRQLYFACDEGRPRLYDEGLAGFLLGTSDPSLGYVSVLLLPPREAQALAGAAADRRQALQLLAGAYSANAFPFSERYQNCNQWVAELLAAAWRPLEAEASSASGETTGEAGDATPRTRAQRWLQRHGYAPTRFTFAFGPLMALGVFIPWVHGDDHPPEDFEQGTYRVSMPASIEAFVHANVPGASRVEFCHTATALVVHRGWTPIADGCRPSEGDTVVPLD